MNVTEKRALLLRLLAERGQARKVYPLSHPQARIWFLERMNPGRTDYHIMHAVRLPIRLDSETLRACWGDLVERHEILRTRIEEREGGPVQVVEPTAEPSLRLFDFRHLPDEERREAVVAAARESFDVLFDLAKAPLFRAALAITGEEESVVILVMHHLIGDNLSIRIIFDELKSLYLERAAGGAGSLPPPKLQYGPFSRWQRECEADAHRSRQLAYWLERLEGMEPLELPTDYAREGVAGVEAGRVSLALSKELTERVQRLGREESFTPFMVTLAAFKAVLARHTGQTDIVVGVPVSGRNRGELLEAVGLYVNNLVLRTDLSGDPTFRAVLEGVKATSVGALSNQDIPFEQLVEELNPARDANRHPLFNVYFSFLQELTTHMPDILEVIDLGHATAKLDISFRVIEETDSLFLICEYDAGLFKPDTVERMLRHVRNVLEDATADPGKRLSQLALLDEDERRTLLVEWNRTAAEYPREASIQELFEEQAAARPGATALSFEGESLSYGELNERANRLARHLRGLGVRAEDPVAVYMERGVELIVSLLAVLKAGGAYVPLDTAYPRERLAFMLEDAKAKVVLTRGEPGERLPCDSLRVVDLAGLGDALAAESAADLPPCSRADNLAYVIYTSGSTGRPKGVMVSHRAVVRLVKGADYASMGPDEVFLQLAAVSFDASTLEVWGSLLNGGRLAVFPPGAPSLEELGAALRRERVTTLWLTAGLFRLMADERPEDLLGLRQLLAGGDVLSVPHVRGLFGHATRTRLINGYGPTENTTFTCCHAVTDESFETGTVPIGRPIANTQVFILDAGLEPVPVGVAGDLYAAGDGLARGYLNSPALTAEKFIPHPFSARGGERLYRTGDVARYLPTGEIEFLGRRDEQLKVRGFRVEPGEIEAVLARHADVRDAVVVALDSEGAGKRLVAYVVGHEGVEVDARALREYARASLPEYMVPSAFVELERIPLTPNGKVDRRALPAPEWGGGEGAQKGTAAAAGEIEELLAGIWAEVLGVSEVGAGENFFELGGHSLLATQVISRVRQSLGVELPLRKMFETPTIAAQARDVIEALGAGGGLGSAPLPRADRGDSLPLSYSQQRLWFLDQLDPNRAVYNIHTAIRMRGQLDLRALEMSLGELARRHEALRTVFRQEGGEPRQVVLPAGDFALPLMDLCESEAGEAEMHRLLDEEARRPFDLSEGPLLRTWVVRLGPEEHVLSVTFHHIISDGWSLSVFGDELTRLYEAYSRGLPSPLVDLGAQYADFAAWQKGWLGGEAMLAKLERLKQSLEGAPPLLELATDRPRPAVQSYRGSAESVVLGEELTARLKQECRRRGVTTYMALMACYQALLHWYSGQEDFLVGSPIAGRNHVETEGLIGLFVNSLVLRADFGADPSFAELLGRVREASLEAYAQQDVPFDRLVEEMEPDRSLSYAPLFQVMFAFHNTPPVEMEIEGLELTRLRGATDTSKFDLSMALEESDGRISGTLEYSSDLFDRETVRRMVGHFEVLVRALLETPDTPVAALDLLTEEERQRVLVEWNDTSCEPAEAVPAHEQIERLAASVPEREAVVAGSGRLSYGELDARANQFAHRLRGLGAGPGGIVAVCMNRSPEMIVALLGVLKAGAAYLPVDPAYPPLRRAEIVSDAGAHIVVTDAQTAGRGLSSSATEIVFDEPDGPTSRLPRTKPAGGATAGDLAYVIYTSGSTGRPKGVMISHGSLANLIAWHLRRHGVNEEDRTTQLAGPGFDASVWEIWPTLAAGASLHLCDEETRLNPERLQQWLVESGISVSFLPTPLAEAVLGLRWPERHGLRTVLTGGERLKQFKPAGVGFRFFNHYGPTESTVVTTCAEVDEESATTAPHIGRPIANTRVYLLNRYLKPVPVGVAGELFIGGGGLAVGYLNRPDQTAEKFIPDPFAEEPGRRMYRSGDLARYLPDGSVEYLGRVDRQVKLRGYRIELGEVEAALQSHPAVSAAAVELREQDAAGPRLVGYVVPAAGSAADAGELRRHLVERLPDYMVPTAYVVLEALPLTPNGKLDRRALPAPEQDGTGAREFKAPSTKTEEELARLWGAVLGLDAVGAADNFFELGGHSLLATRLMSRVRESFGLELPLKSLFERPTVEGLAELIDDADAASTAAEVEVIKPEPRDGPAPLSFAQQRLWFLDRLVPGSPAYNISIPVRISAPLDTARLERAINFVLGRHESLRTIFAEEGGEPTQVVLPHDEAARTLDIVDLSSIADEREREEAASRLAEQEAGRAFDLARGPLSRWTLVRLGADEHMLVVTIHHIVFDGWSMGVLVRELRASYFAGGEPEGLGPLPIQYADYALWQRRRADGEAMRRELDYWRRQLAGAPALLELPTDRPRPKVQGAAGAVWRTEVDGELTRRVRLTGREHGATTFMVMLASFHAVLSRYSGQRDIVVGSPIAGRNRVELEDLIGFFVNTLALRVDLSGEPDFNELLRRVKQVTLDAFAHQEVPFERLVEELQPERSLAYAPLVQVMFDLKSREEGEDAGPADFSVVQREARTAKFDLSVGVVEAADGMTWELQYRTDLFDEETIAQLGRHWESLLRALVAEPTRPFEDVDLLGEGERRELLAWGEGAALPGVRETVTEMFRARVAEKPKAVALVEGDEVWSYRRLDEESERLAEHLAGIGIGPESVVGVCLPRSARQVAALLGVLKSGAAFLPLDPDYPEERLAYTARDAGARAVITDEAMRRVFGPGVALTWREVPAGRRWGRRARRPVHNVVPDGLAYVIYTSGSTGRPKGVMVSHTNLANLVRWHQETFRLTREDRGSYVAGLGFDASVWELWPYLTAGAAVEIPDDEARLDAERFALWVAERGVSVAFAPTPLAERLFDVGWEKGRLRALLTGGDRLVGRPDASIPFEVWNNYGPTETTVVATSGVVEPSGEGPPSIGRPVANARCYVLDRRMEPAPFGVTGELYVGGAGVGRGYLGRASLTAERFVPDPFGEAGARLYRTGDLVRLRRGGALEFVGRSDQQVKLRGFRIELGEIESALREAAGVAEAAVLLRDDLGGGPALVGYVTPRAGGSLPPEEELRAGLGRRLPEYMVPRVLVELAELPLTPSGKVDKRALPKPAESARGTEPPREGNERAVAEIWEELLGVEKVYRDDDFFRLGGHSLLATQVIARLRARLGVELPLVVFFRNPVLSEFAAAIDGLTNEGPDPLFVEIGGAGTASPLVLVHPVGGSVLAYRALARELGDGRQIIGVQSPPAEELCATGSLEELAKRYAEGLLRNYPREEYVLAGWSMGGLVALEMARLLAAEGRAVPFVGLIDSQLPPRAARAPEEGRVFRWYLEDVAGQGSGPAERLAASLLESADGRAAEEVWERASREPAGCTPEDVEVLKRSFETFRQNVRLLYGYEPGSCDSRVVLFRADASAKAGPVRLPPARELHVVGLPGDHYSLMRPPHVGRLSALLSAELSGGGRETVGGGR